jgi:hypothetical protein
VARAFNPPARPGLKPHTLLDSIPEGIELDPVSGERALNGINENIRANDAHLSNAAHDLGNLSIHINDIQINLLPAITTRIGSKAAEVRAAGDAEHAAGNAHLNAAAAAAGGKVAISRGPEPVQPPPPPANPATPFISQRAAAVLARGIAFRALQSMLRTLTANKQTRQTSITELIRLQQVLAATRSGIRITQQSMQGNILQTNGAIIKNQNFQEIKKGLGRGNLNVKPRVSVQSLHIFVKRGDAEAIANHLKARNIVAGQGFIPVINMGPKATIGGISEARFRLSVKLTDFGGHMGDLAHNRPPKPRFAGSESKLNTLHADILSANGGITREQGYSEGLLSRMASDMATILRASSDSLFAGGQIRAARLDSYGFGGAIPGVKSMIKVPDYPLQSPIDAGSTRRISSKVGEIGGHIKLTGRDLPNADFFRKSAAGDVVVLGHAIDGLNLHRPTKPNLPQMNVDPIGAGRDLAGVGERIRKNDAQTGLIKPFVDAANWVVDRIGSALSALLKKIGFERDTLKIDAEAMAAAERAYLLRKDGGIGSVPAKPNWGDVLEAGAAAAAALPFRKYRAPPLDFSSILGNLAGEIGRNMAARRRLEGRRDTVRFEEGLIGSSIKAANKAIHFFEFMINWGKGRNQQYFSIRRALGKENGIITGLEGAQVGNIIRKRQSGDDLTNVLATDKIIIEQGLKPLSEMTGPYTPASIANARVTLLGKLHDLGGYLASIFFKKPSRPDISALRGIEGKIGELHGNIGREPGGLSIELGELGRLGEILDGFSNRFESGRFDFTKDVTGAGEKVRGFEGLLPEARGRAKEPVRPKEGGIDHSSPELINGKVKRRYTGDEPGIAAARREAAARDAETFGKAIEEYMARRQHSEDGINGLKPGILEREMLDAEARANKARDDMAANEKVKDNISPKPDAIDAHVKDDVRDMGALERDIADAAAREAAARKGRDAADGQHGKDADALGKKKDEVDGEPTRPNEADVEAAGKAAEKIKPKEPHVDKPPGERLREDLLDENDRLGKRSSYLRRMIEYLKKFLKDIYERIKKALKRGDDEEALIKKRKKKREDREELLKKYKDEIAKARKRQLQMDLLLIAIILLFIFIPRIPPRPIPPKPPVYTNLPTERVSGPTSASKPSGPSGSRETNLPSGPIKPEPRPPSNIVWPNIACLTGSYDYRLGCRAGATQGTLDGARDGYIDEQADAKRILPYTMGEVQFIAESTIVFSSSQELAAFCTQVQIQGAPWPYDLKTIYPFCGFSPGQGRKPKPAGPSGPTSPVPAPPAGYGYGYGQGYGYGYGYGYGEQKGGAITIAAAQSADYRAGYMEGYNSAYPLCYAIGWAIAKAGYPIETPVFNLPPSIISDGDGYGYGYGYGNGYGHTYGYSQGGGKRKLKGLSKKTVDLLKRIVDRTSPQPAQVV